MVQGYIYRHWIINDEGVEKNYIGQTTTRPTRRWRDDGSGYLKRNSSKFSNAIKKYGWENFSHEIIGIVESDTKEQLVRDLDEWEKYYIEKYDSFHNGYNSTTGGGNGLASEETKRKMSKARKGRKPPMLGKKHTEESKKRMSVSRKGTRTGGDNPTAKKVICITTGETFDTLSQARDFYGVDTSALAKHCKGKTKSCGKHPITGEKLIWKYYE